MVFKSRILKKHSNLCYYISMKKLIILTLLCLSCSSESDQPITEIDDPKATKSHKQNEVWICHHPGTVFHGKVWVEETFPEGCYVSGDNSKFCWLMLKNEDCPGTESDPWSVHCD